MLRINLFFLLIWFGTLLNHGVMSKKQDTSTLIRDDSDNYYGKNNKSIRRRGAGPRHRHRRNMKQKGETSIHRTKREGADMYMPIDEEEEANSHVPIGAGVGGGGLVDDGGSNDGSYLENICDILFRFDQSGRGAGNDPSIPGLEWYNHCDKYAEQNYLLCPNSYEVGKICEHRNPHLNPAVKTLYCQELFEPFIDRIDDYYTNCVKYCTNYVSKHRGDCCNFTCASSTPSTVPSSSPSP